MIGHHQINNLPVTLNMSVDSATKILRALDQMPHNMVRELIDDITAQVNHQIQQHAAAAQALNQQASSPVAAADIPVPKAENPEPSQG